jgi:hypothetical protein
MRNLELVRRETSLMGLSYQTEYRLGRRGGTVRRSYTGVRAFLAIAIDLFFVLTFDLVFGLLFFLLRQTLTLLTFIFYILSLPFRFARWVSLRLERRPTRSVAGLDRGTLLKPAWPAYDEV